MPVKMATGYIFKEYWKLKRLENGIVSWMRETNVSVVINHTKT